MSTTFVAQGVSEDAGAGTKDVVETGAAYAGMPVLSTQAGEALNVVSSSAADAAAGTGQRTIKICGLNAAGVYQEDTVTLNGVTPVVTATTWVRVFRAFGITAGSGGTNAGAITIKHNVTTANVFAVIKAGRSQAMLGVFTVPAGREARVVSWGGQVYGQSATAAAEIVLQLMARPTGANQGWRVLRQLTVPAVPTTKAVDRPEGAGLRVGSLTDIKIVAVGVTASSKIAVDLNVEYSG